MAVGSSSTSPVVASIKMHSGLADPPDPPDPERPVWEALYGLRPVPRDAPYGPRLALLPPCDGPFYWWTDIF